MQSEVTPRVRLRWMGGDDALTVIAEAARTCKTKSTLDASVASMDMEKNLGLIRHCIKAGHESVLEHVSLTFYVDGVSRALTHQLVRHRLCSFSQQSQRHVDPTSPSWYVIPPSIKMNVPACSMYEAALTMAKQAYIELKKSGVPEEDARYILPNSCQTSVVVTMNLREFLHICRERLCCKAQWEIKQLVEEMKDRVLETAYWLKEYLAPKCSVTGKCVENPDKPAHKEEESGCGADGCSFD